METVDKAKHWDWLWTRKLTNFYTHIPGTYTIEKFARKFIHFNAIDKLLGSVQLVDKNIIELGSGTGSNSLHIAQTRKVRSVTLVDFSKIAFTRVNVQLYPCPVIKVNADILNFHPDIEYDFVHSTGVVEHFYDGERKLVIEKHTQCVKKGGLVMIWAPILSKTFKYIGKINRYLKIEEKPFTKDELCSLCIKSKLEIIREEETAFGSLYGILARRKE